MSVPWNFAVPAPLTQPQHQLVQQPGQVQVTPAQQQASLTPTSASREPPTTLHWFRLDCLRLHDNPAFTAAVTSGQPFKAIFIIDPWFNANYNHGPGVNVWRFLLESLRDLDGHLRKKPYNSCLNVFIGQPTVLLPQIFKQWNVTKLTFQASQVSHESMRHDEIIQLIGRELNVEVQTFFSHTLYDPSLIIAANNGQVPITYKDFRRLLPMLGKPDDPIPEPDPIRVALSVANTEKVEEPEGTIPTLQDLGFAKDEALYTNSWVGGETEALRRLCSFCTRRVQTVSEDPVNWLVSKDSLSPYIRFGCLSPRQLFSKLRQFASVSTRGQALFEQLTKNLLLREFAYLVGSSSPKFDLMYGNPLCIQLPWDENERYLQTWREGKTGYPWIDAIIRQCRKDGWAHFLARQSIAVFLTRGYLWVSWVLGKDFFQEFMLDFELPVSTVCWMQSSCSGFFCNQIESFDPCLVGKQMDMNGSFIKTYIPELRDFPTEYIHQPWKAPAYVQKAAGCVIGQDYPAPVVEVCEQGQLCCKRIQSIMSALHEVYNTEGAA